MRSRYYLLCFAMTCSAAFVACQPTEDEPAKEQTDGGGDVVEGDDDGSTPAAECPAKDLRNRT